MSMSNVRGTHGAGALILLAVVAGVLSTPPSAAAQSADGFLLERPTTHLDLSFGFAVPRARGGLFDFTTERLTLESADYRSPAVGGALGFRVTERFDLAMEVGYAGSEARSEDADFVDEAGRPIEQTTRLTRVPFGAVLRFYPRERGRTVGSFAWIPRDIAPYVGAGGGWVWSRFEQEGDFVDDEREVIFTDRFRSSDTSPAFHLVGGVDYSLTPRFVLSGEARYTWSSAELDPSVFGGFGDLDLSGFQATAGVSVRW